MSRKSLALVAAGALVAVGVTPIATAQPAVASPITISKADYLDKTLAGILGQVGGFLSGYEFHPVYGANPLPDSCFEPSYGPYSGDAPLACWTPHSYPGYDRLGAPHFNSNEVGSDDDYHVDFFIQHVLDEHGPDVTFQNIKTEWVEHDVRDFGPGKIANDTMRNDNFFAPATGRAEYNRFFWLTEGYIETETLGMVAPGMPETARALGERFSQITTEFDSVEWAEFFAAAYAIAYFETDARVAMHKAADALPRGGWPHAIYQKAVALHAQDSTDWRWALSELMDFVRNVYQNDNALALPDRNNGAFILSVLYGENDYEETLKIASLSGNDADCTASAAGGLMGIIKGMAGSPSEFNDRIYMDGDGRYINDLVTGFDPFIANNYPTSQSWDAIAALYQSNAEAQIVARGGSVGATTYTIASQTLAPPVDIQVHNYDFEHGTLANWGVWTPSTDPGAPNAHAEQTSASLSGEWRGRIETDASVDEIKLYTSLRGLEHGARYRVESFVMTNQAAHLFVDNHGSSEVFASAVGTTGVVDREWVNRSVEFTVSGTSANVGLHLLPGADGFAAIDDLKVTKLNPTATATYEAEAASRNGGSVQTSPTASNGQYVGGLDNVGDWVEFTVTVPSAGEYRADFLYANGWSGFSRLNLLVNGVAQAGVPFPRTESWGSFSRNMMSVPVDLASGSNTIRVVRPADGGYVELDALELGRYPAVARAAVSSNLLANPGFEVGGAPTQAPPSWVTWPGSTGLHATADFVELDGFDGGFRLTHYRATPYEVFTSQTLSGIPDGTYTLSAWAAGGGGQTDVFLSAKNYGTSVPELTSRIPGLGWPEWRRVVVPGIVVTNGQIEVGMYSNADSGQWASIDGLELRRQ